jgi:hypothetical protein
MSETNYQTQSQTQQQDAYQGRGRKRGDKVYIWRHSIKPTEGDKESSIYQGISEGGVKKARDAVQGILKKLEEAAPGTVMFLGGVSEEIRTASTARVYGEELKRLVGDNSKYLVVTERDLAEGKYGTKQVYEQGSHPQQQIQENIKYIIAQNPKKKIVFDVPMVMEDLSSRTRGGKIGWFDENGKPTKYTKALMDRVGGKDQNKALKYWIEKNNPEIQGMYGPKPIEVAQRYARAINNLEKSLHQFVGDRPLITGLVGHSWEADTFLAYLAGDGNKNISVKNLDKIANNRGMIKETERAELVYGNTGMFLHYREKEHRVNKSLEQLVMIFGVLSLLLGLVSMTNITGNAVGVEEVNIFSSVFIALAIIFAILFFQLRKHHHKR